jgi:sugar/nucleoside kinase (ribokinase family)
MKVLVIGHLCIDVAHPHRDAQTSGSDIREQWGGIANAVAVLGSLAANGDIIIPVCGAGKDDLESFRSWMKQFPAVDPAGVFSLDRPTNRIHVFEREDGHHVTCTRDINPPIPYDKLKKYLGIDGILLNMVSGADITLETLDSIRMDVRGKEVVVHFDYHHLTTGIDEKNERFRRPLPEWRRWAFMNTSIQCNEAEIAGITIEGLSEEQTAGHFLTLGVKGVVVTRGARGATLYTSEHKKLTRHDVAGQSVPSLSDSTGLGDVFGAAFLRQTVMKGDLAASTAYANEIAARVGSIPRARRSEFLQLH